MALEIGTEVTSDFGPFIPVQAKPAKIIQDSARGVLDVSRAVGVLYAQDHAPADLAGEQPIEQHRAGPADVQIAGG